MNVIDDDVEMVLASTHDSEEDTLFEMALIKYVTLNGRTLFLEYADTWKDFHNANLGDFEIYNHFAPEELRAHFLKNVLPVVFNYELTQKQKNYFDLLKLHPEYESTEKGFRRLPPEKRITFCRQPKVGSDFQPETQPQSGKKWFLTNDREKDAESEAGPSQLVLPGFLPATHTLITTVPYEHQRSGDDFVFSDENAALISAALSNDFELSGCVLLEPREMHKRLREAKRNFEQHARMPENCRDIEKLLEKIQKLTELRKAVVDVVSKNF